MSELPAAIQLSIVSTAMDSVLLDLERARMEREDFRQGNAPARLVVTHTGDRTFTWRQDDMIQCNNINVAHDALFTIKEELRDMDGRVPRDLADNYSQMVAEVNAVLGSESEPESEGESEESEESEESMSE